MSFESFNTPEITPDEEQAVVWKKVEDYFEKIFGEVEQSPAYDSESLEEIHQVLNAIERQDYSKAFEYFDKTIEGIRSRIPLYEENEIGREITIPAIRQEIEDLEKLRDSLLLEEQ